MDKLRRIAFNFCQCCSVSMVRDIANNKIGFGDLILLLRYFFKLKVSTHPNYVNLNFLTVKISNSSDLLGQDVHKNSLEINHNLVDRAE